MRRRTQAGYIPTAIRSVEMRSLLERRVIGLLAVAITIALTVPGAAAFAQNTDGARDKRVSLADIWLVFPNVSSVAWPHSYIRADTTADSQQARRDDLFKELESLDWRLEHRGYEQYRLAVADWRAALADVDRYRVPGQWSPAWLMAHPHQRPPVSQLTALGACRLPSWVEVWDSQGVSRTAWQPGLTLSEVTRELHPIDAGPSDTVAVVNPQGEVDHYGVAAWNFADTPLPPGSRVVVALPLAGEGLIWVRDAMARLLAHQLPGDSCREVPINAKAGNG